jgi:hypothetical protein
LAPTSSTAINKAEKLTQRKSNTAASQTPPIEAVVSIALFGLVGALVLSTPMIALSIAMIAVSP